MSFLSNFFGGGAYSSAIDYESFPYPACELGSAALEGRVLSSAGRNPRLSVATFAGGCFWGLELAYQRVPGVLYTAVGYTQGDMERPSYSAVCAGGTGHTEAVAVFYDPSAVEYGTLLDVFLDRVDVTTVNGQGNDFGTQYRTGVYTHNADQMKMARARFEEVAEIIGAGPRGPKTVATELLEAKVFWPAEKYHQQYLEKGGQSAEKNSKEKIRCYG
eukprot:CAMPEP_0113322252 /NCGR_PEP_ID=MMETSP0010_2-20120614/15480_1 /TAXON_ID=216773 ORGANISM="Corethron hystrix, Strain 308" /NCGR_SAMPLE_ID=MMETSP0010_2 /ASSEMBLY_ACC=CAM_ASM_000155 /LENGTH=216 /DNA_ID=CAMNT_0000180687 /DNA_START=184 /DNA_END=834 /DNA_ORIENTATION=- /assembly_acc=CAM_ASM_000155